MQLDYSSAPPRRNMTPALLAGLFSTIPASLISFVLGYCTPWVAGILRDFKVPPNACLRLLFAASRSFTEYNGWTIIWIMPLLVAFAFHWATRRSESPTLPLLALIVAESVLLTFFTLFAAYGLSQPIISLMTSVSPPAAPLR